MIESRDNSKAMLVICEIEDRWTKMLRRIFRDVPQIQVVRLSGVQYVDDLLEKQVGQLVCIDLGPDNLAHQSPYLFRLVSARKHRLVGLCREFHSVERPLLRGIGLDACFFSLTDVKCLARLAERHFKAKSQRSPGEELRPDEDSIRERLRQRIPEF